MGYTDLPSRLPQTSSQLYANNIAKLILATGPQTTKDKGYWYIDHEDPVSRGMLVVEEGEVRVEWVGRGPGGLLLAWVSESDEARRASVAPVRWGEASRLVDERSA